MSEIYKIKMELTKNEYDRLCWLLNMDINFVQPAKTEPNTLSEEIMRKMRVEIKTRDYEADNRTLNEAIANEEKQMTELETQLKSTCENKLHQELFDKYAYHKILYVLLCDLRDWRELDGKKKLICLQQGGIE